MFRFIHVSDTHLGYRQYGLIERERDFYEVFRWVVDRAVELKVDAILHAGDMFHSAHPRPVTYEYVYDVLRRCRDAGIRFLVAPGNHELPKSIGVGSPVRVLAKMGLLEAPLDPGKPYIARFDGADVIVFSEWASHLLASVNPHSLTQPGKPVIALAHVTLCDALKQTEGVPEEECLKRRGLQSSQLLNKGYSYIALGDIHTPWEQRLDKAPPIVYPGSTEYLGVDEYLRNPSRFVYLVELGDDGVVRRMERLKIEIVRPWIVVEDSYSKVLSVLSNLKRGQGKEPIVYVRVQGSISQVDRSRLTSLLDNLRESGVILYYKLEVEDKGVVRQVTQTSTVGRASIHDVVYELARRCPESVRDKVAKLLVELIENPYESQVKLVKSMEEDLEVVKCLERVTGGVLGL